MLIPSNAQNTYLIYSLGSLLLQINCSNVLNTLFINKAVVNLDTRALVTYIYLYLAILLYALKEDRFALSC